MTGGCATRLRTVVLPEGLNLLVGRDVQDHAELRTLIIDGLCWAAATAFLLAIVGAILVRCAVLSRVGMINDTASAIINGDLSQRVPARDATDAFDRLAQTINAMLQQIQQLIERVRNTSNAIAHDLRTPLAELRARLEELLRTRPETAITFEEIHKAVADLDRVIAVFNALLRLAEIDSGLRRSGVSPRRNFRPRHRGGRSLWSAHRGKRSSLQRRYRKRARGPRRPLSACSGGWKPCRKCREIRAAPWRVGLRIASCDDRRIEIVVADKGPASRMARKPT